VTVDKVIAKIARLTFFGPPCISQYLYNYTQRSVSCTVHRTSPLPAG